MEPTALWEACPAPRVRASWEAVSSGHPAHVHGAAVEVFVFTFLHTSMSTSEATAVSWEV